MVNKYHISSSNKIVPCKAEQRHCPRVHATKDELVAVIINPESNPTLAAAVKTSFDRTEQKTQPAKRRQYRDLHAKVFDRIFKRIQDDDEDTDRETELQKVWKLIYEVDQNGGNRIPKNFDANKLYEAVNNIATQSHYARFVKFLNDPNLSQGIVFSEENAEDLLIRYPVVESGRYLLTNHSDNLSPRSIKLLQHIAEQVFISHSHSAEDLRFVQSYAVTINNVEALKKLIQRPLFVPNYDEKQGPTVGTITNTSLAGHLLMNKTIHSTPELEQHIPHLARLAAGTDIKHYGATVRNQATSYFKYTQQKTNEAFKLNKWDVITPEDNVLDNRLDKMIEAGENLGRTRTSPVIEKQLRQARQQLEKVTNSKVVWNTKETETLSQFKHPDATLFANLQAEYDNTNKGWKELVALVEEVKKDNDGFVPSHLRERVDNAVYYAHAYSL